MKAPHTALDQRMIIKNLIYSDSKFSCGDMRVYFHGQKLESKCQLVTLKTHFLNVSIKGFPRENSLNVLVFPKGRVHPPPLQFINGQGHVHPPPLYTPPAVYQQTRACPFPHFCIFPYSLSIDRGMPIPHFCTFPYSLLIDRGVSIPHFCTFPHSL